MKAVRAKTCSRIEALAIITQAIAPGIRIDRELLERASAMSSFGKNRAGAEGFALAFELALQETYLKSKTFKSRTSKKKTVKKMTPDGEIIEEETTIGKAIAEAQERFSKAEATGAISADVHGFYRILNVKKLAPASRGRGKGRGPNLSHPKGPVDRMIEFILTNMRISDVELIQRGDLNLPYSDLQETSHGKPAATSRFRPFRKYCVDLAQQRLASYDIEGVPRPTDSELGTMRNNVQSWSEPMRSPGRPRGARSRNHVSR